MARRTVWLCMVVALALLVPFRAFAVDWYTDRTAWQSAVGIWADVDIEGQVGDLEDFDAGSPLALPYSETLVFSNDLQGRQVPDSWYGAWEGDPRVLWTRNMDGLVLGTFGGGGGGGVWAFALEVSDTHYGLQETLVTLSDGATLTQEQLVTYPGEGGYAAFFGWVGGSTTWFEVDSTNHDLGMGRMMKAEAPGAVPELPPFALAALGLLPLALKLRRKK